jgi:hypothetical protein
VLSDEESKVDVEDEAEVLEAAALEAAVLNVVAAVVALEAAVLNVPVLNGAVLVFVAGEVSEGTVLLNVALLLLADALGIGSVAPSPGLEHPHINQTDNKLRTTPAALFITVGSYEGFRGTSTVDTLRVNEAA